ncbi:MAG: hypothetical protein ACSLFP_04830 [Acidimicrobiales bacterium]
MTQAPIEGLRLALEVVAYELERRPADYRCADPIEALERLRETPAPPGEGAPLKESYPAVVTLAARALVALASLPEPDEVDGLSDLAGFEEWRRHR